MNEFDVIVVGSGPAGCSTAISLHRLDPARAGRVLILEKERHPRPKLCAGGITPYCDHLLSQLGVRPAVPSVPVHVVRFQFRWARFCLRARNILRVVRRDEFDAALADAVRRRGITIHEHEPVLDVRRADESVQVVTERNTYQAKVVVGADGAKSVVRRKLGLDDASHVSRVMEILTPAASSPDLGFDDHTAVLDFSCLADDVQGYVWTFPCLVNGEPTYNRGIFDSRVHFHAGRGPLRQVFFDALVQRGLNPADYHLMGHPERWFDLRGTYAVPRVLLAGDAAGVEPLFGEGISHALQYGMVAASAIQDAFARNDLSFRDYTRRILRHKLGRQLTWKICVARLVYGLRNPTLYTWIVALAGLIL